MMSTKIRATGYALLAAIVVTYGLGIEALVIDDNPGAAYALFWAAWWMLIGWRHLNKIDQLRAERDLHATTLKRMATFLTEDQLTGFADRVGRTATRTPNSDA
ncbi:hypothetical protein ACWDRB_47335 [Nonomuraea sp. NPDC003707]